MRPGSLFSGLFHPSVAEQAAPFADDRPRGVATPQGNEDSVFDGGPPIGLLTRLGLMRPGTPQIGLRMMLVIAVGWAPLVVLAAFRDLATHDGSFADFLSDYGVHARSLIAAPLLILAEAVCLPRFSAIARHFATAGLVEAGDRERFSRAVASTLRLRDSTQLEVAVLALAATLVVTLGITVPAHIFPQWQRIGAHHIVTPAALWHDFVSVPLLMVLFLGWVWRIVLWARFLVLVSRLRLTLVAAHPDRSGGLGFLGNSLEATAILAFTLGVVVAGTVANRVVNDGVSLLSFRTVLIVFTAVVTVLFISPLVAFTPILMKTWRRGVFEYGALAHSLGRQMEQRWLNHDATPESLSVGDFSATTDLYSIVANVGAMWPLPIALRNVVVLVVATLAPFLPVALMFMSASDLVQKLTGIAL